MKLIGIDLDGTLLNSQQSISSTNVKALQNAAKTMMPFICSGRDINDIANLLKKFNLNIPAVGLNGAIAMNNDKTIFELPIDNQVIDSIYNEIKDFPLKIYTNMGSFESQDYKNNLIKTFKKFGQEFDRTELEYELAYEKTITSTSFKDISELTSINHLKILKFFIFIPNTDVKAPIKERLSKIKELSVTESAPINLEINPAIASKGASFDHLKEHFGFDNVETYAIGDGLNDLSMFNRVDQCFAMKNADPYILNIADYVVASNDDNGVSQALTQIKTL